MHFVYPSTSVSMVILVLFYLICEYFKFHLIFPDIFSKLGGQSVIWKNWDIQI